MTLLRPGSGRARSSSALSRAAQHGELKRLRPGIYVRAEQWDHLRLRGRHRAYCAALGLTTPSAIFCCTSALSLYGVPLLSWPRWVHFRCATGATAGHRRTEFFPVHIRRPLRPAGVTAREADHLARGEGLARPYMWIPVAGVVFEDDSPVKIKVEPLPHVLVDTLPGMSRQEAVMVLDAALAGRYGYGKRVRDPDLDGAENVLRKRDSAQWRELRAFADARSESPGESRCRVLFDELGFEAPQLQKELSLPRIGRIRVDFWWEDIVCEFDGMIKYTRGFSGQAAEQVVQREKLREDALRLLDYRVVRLTWSDLNHPEELGRKLLLAGVPHRALRQFTAAA